MTDEYEAAAIRYSAARGSLNKLERDIYDRRIQHLEQDMEFLWWLGIINSLLIGGYFIACFCNK